jgi:hypothetical protein
MGIVYQVVTPRLASAEELLFDWRVDHRVPNGPAVRRASVRGHQYDQLRGSTDHRSSPALPVQTG